MKNIGDYKNIHNVNLLCLFIDQTDGYIEESLRNKYLVFIK